MDAGAVDKELKLPPLTKPKLQKNTSTLSLAARANKNLPRPESTSHQPGLIFVRYGANQKMILNSFCQTLHLLNFMKRLSGCKSLESVDLMSWRAGELQNISDLTLDYAYRFLKNRETYLLVKITETYGDKQTLPQYQSLLENLDRYNPELVAKLEQLSKPAKSLSLKNKWTSIGKKGADGGSRPERKSGLSTILAAHRAKTPTQKHSDIIGVIAAAKSAAIEQENRNNHSAKKRKPSTKLPPITTH